MATKISLASNPSLTKDLPSRFPLNTLHNKCLLPGIKVVSLNSMPSSLIMSTRLSSSTCIMEATRWSEVVVGVHRWVAWTNSRPVRCSSMIRHSSTSLIYWRLRRRILQGSKWRCPETISCISKRISKRLWQPGSQRRRSLSWKIPYSREKLSKWVKTKRKTTEYQNKLASILLIKHLTKERVDIWYLIPSKEQEAFRILLSSVQCTNAFMRY